LLIQRPCAASIRDLKSFTLLYAKTKVNAVIIIPNKIYRILIVSVQSKIEIRIPKYPIDDVVNKVIMTMITD